MEGHTSAPPGSRTLGDGLDSLVERLLTLQLANCGPGSPGAPRGACRARKECGGRANEPTSTLNQSSTAFICLGVLVKFHLKNAPFC